MNLATFKKELGQALEKPNDWYINGQFLTHRRTGIYMLASSIGAEGVAGLDVFTSVGNVLLRIGRYDTSFRAAANCNQAVQNRGQRAQEQRDAHNRQTFLRTFSGFDGDRRKVRCSASKQS